MVIADGTLSPSGSGTEDTLLPAETTQGNFVLLFDRSNMENGDELVIRVATKVLSTGDEKTILIFPVLMHNAALPDDPIIISIPFPSRHSFSLYATQMNDSPKDFDWALWKL